MKHQPGHRKRANRQSTYPSAASVLCRWLGDSENSCHQIPSHSYPSHNFTRYLNTVQPDQLLCRTPPIQKPTIQKPTKLALAFNNSARRQGRPRKLKIGSSCCSPCLFRSSPTATHKHTGFPCGSGVGPTGVLLPPSLPRRDAFARAVSAPRPPAYARGGQSTGTVRALDAM